MKPILFICLTLAALCVPAAQLAAAEPALGSTPTSDQIFAHGAFEVFRRSCAECHDDASARRTKGFGYVLDLKQLVANPDYIVPGSADESELFLSMIGESFYDFMPPDDAESPMPTPADIAMVRAWIEAGAPTLAPVDDTATSTADSGTAGSDTGTLGPEHIVTDEDKEFVFEHFLGHLHPLLVHFPIALLTVAMMSEVLLALCTGMTWLAGATRFSLWISAPAGILAAVTGWVNADISGRDESVFNHRWLGVATAVLAVIALGVCEWSVRSGKRRLLLAILIIGAALVAIAGHTGGELVYGEGYLW